MVHKFLIRCSAFVFLIFLGFFYLTPNIGAESPPITLVSNGALSFDLTGAKGGFRESTTARYYINVNEDKKIKIRFEASELSYEGSERINLNAVYWVNDNKKASFSAGKPLVLGREMGSHPFYLHGQVTIDAIEAQPSGKYKGTITVTVYEERS